MKFIPIVGLAGKTNWESACVDQYADLTNDLFLEIVKTFFEKDEEQKVSFHEMAIKI